jgi:hypothetical protein
LALRDWNPFKPFAREPSEVAAILENALNGSLDCRMWDDFICIPIKGTPAMDRVREECESLAPDESIGTTGLMEFSGATRARLEILLSEVRRDL